MLEHALRYARAGLSVFPLMPGTKKPFPGSEGFKDATTDVAQIERWWTQYPDANIGFWPGGSGLVCLDLDPGHAPLALPFTATVYTPRGEHRYYASELQFSNRGLAPHVDVRATNGYTLLPPSIIDAREGTHATPGQYHGDDPVMCEPLPEWVAAKLREKPEARKTEKRIDEIDTEQRIARVYELAAAADPATIGQGSNDQTMELVNRLLDWCSHEVVLDALIENWMPRCIGEWTVEWVADKVVSCVPGCGRDSDIGCNEDISYPALPKPEKGRYAGMWPSEFAGLSEPTYWDDTRMIPRVDGDGAVVLVHGPYGRGKTNMVLTWIMDMVAIGAKVCYAAGEGARGVGKHRLPAHCAARGIELSALDGKLRVVPAIPLLQDPIEVDAFIEAQREFNPDVIVLDTLATATAGMEENSSEFASLLTDNGSVGRIKRTFQATVMVIAHEGKDSSRGARGHSGLGGNVDAVLQVNSEGSKIDVFVAKMRDGDDKFHTYYAVEPQGVPVPKRISESEFNGEIEREDDGIWEAFMVALRTLEARDITSAVSMAKVTGHMLQVNPYLSSTSESLRKQLERCRTGSFKKLDGVRVGRDNRGTWLYGICPTDIEE